MVVVADCHTSGGVARREAAAALGVGALRSAEPEPGDLSAERGVPWPAALALGTAGLRGLLSLGVGGVPPPPPPPPFFSLSGFGLPLLFASAEPDLRSNQETEPPSDDERMKDPPPPAAAGIQPRAGGVTVIKNQHRRGCDGRADAYLVLEPCIAAPVCPLPQLLLGLASSRSRPFGASGRAASLSNEQAGKWSAMNAEKFGEGVVGERLRPPCHH